MKLLEASTIQGSLYATLGWILDLARSEAERHNALALERVGRINLAAKQADGNAVVGFDDVPFVPLLDWKGGGFDNVEDTGLSLVDGEKVQARTWRTTNRLQKSTWDSDIEDFIDAEMERLGPLLKLYDFISVEFGRDWTEEPGAAQRAWLDDTIKTVNRFNASSVAKKCGVYLVLRAAHIEVMAGEGLLRPMRPHWHLVLAVRRHRGGKGEWRRLDRAVAQLRKLAGAEVTYEGDFVRDRPALRRMLEYLLRYPPQLVHPTKREDSGLRKKIDLDDEVEGLRLVPFPPPLNQWHRSTLPVLPVAPPLWDGLTDPVVLLDPFKALAGFVLLQRYDLPGSSKKKELTPKAKVKKELKTFRKKTRAEMKATWVTLSPWMKFRLLDFWLRVLLALPRQVKDPNARNVLIRSHLKKDSSGKTKRRALVRNVTTLDEFKAKHPELALEWEHEKGTPPGR